MVDELNDERDVEIDQMTDRIRALEAERDAATARADSVEVMGNRLAEKLVTLEAERDAAVKRAEEAERRIHEYMAADDGVAHRKRVADTLEHLGWGRPDVVASLRSQFERVRGAATKVLVLRDEGSLSGLPGVLVTELRAALSPSPVSARCPVCRAPAGQPHKMSCRPEERATKHYVESSPVSGETYRIGVDVGSPDGDRTVRVGWKQREDGTAEVVALRVEEPPVSGAAAKEPRPSSTCGSCHMGEHDRCIGTLFGGTFCECSCHRPGGRKGRTMSEHCYILGCRYPDSCDHIERTPPASPEEHRRVQAEAAAMRHILDGLACEMEGAVRHHERPRTGMQVPFHGDFASVSPGVIGRLRWWAREMRQALSSSAGSALLEEMAEAQTQRDAMTDNCHRLMAERDQARAESADLRARLEAVEKERDGAVRDLDGLREAWGNERAEFVQRDAALRLAMRQGLEAGVEEVVVALAQEQMAADAHAPAAWCAAEVRRAVEAEREACAQVASSTPCPKGHSATSTGYMAGLIASAIRSRGGA